MSRSRKKVGIVKDRGWMKGLYNRKFRRVNKQRIRMGKDPYEMKELINPYDVSDWIYRWRGDEYERWWFEEHQSWYRHHTWYKSFESYRREYFGK